MPPAQYLQKLVNTDDREVRIHWATIFLGYLAFLKINIINEKLMVLSKKHKRRHHKKLKWQNPIKKTTSTGKMDDE
jgi:hypothetical protein